MTEVFPSRSPISTAPFFQVSIGNATTLWLEEAGRDDYMGNDVGITSRNEFLRTGTRKKPDSETSPVSAIPPRADAPLRSADRRRDKSSEGRIGR